MPEPDAYDVLRRITDEIRVLVNRIQTALPSAVVHRCSQTQQSNLRNSLVESHSEYLLAYHRIIALQEELDWEAYRLFGLSSEGANSDVLANEAIGITADQRPFLWAGEYACEALPEEVRTTYEARRRDLSRTPELAIIEDSVFKRPWWGRQGVYGRLSRDYGSWVSEALECRLRDRLESYFDFDGRMNDERKPTSQLRAVRDVLHRQHRAIPDAHPYQFSILLHLKFDITARYNAPVCRFDCQRSISQRAVYSILGKVIRFYDGLSRREFIRGNRSHLGETAEIGGGCEHSGSLTAPRSGRQDSLLPRFVHDSVKISREI